MNNKFKNEKQGGFLKLIIIIIIAIFLIKYFNISISGIIEWLESVWNQFFN
jgi:hypothetical protein